MVGSYVVSIVFILNKFTIFVYLGRLPVQNKYFVAKIGDDTSMEYLIPTTSNSGVCSTALVDFLTLTHNKFIERCRAVLEKLNQGYVFGIL